MRKMAIESRPEIDPEVLRMLDEGCPNDSLIAKRIGRGVLDGVIGLDNARAARRAILDEGPNQEPKGENLSSPRQ